MNTNGHPPGKILIHAAQIQHRVDAMGWDITHDFLGQELVVLCVLKGALFMTTDLLRHIHMDVKLDFIRASSYGDGQESSGEVKILIEPETDLRGKAVLAVEDIIDTGLSINAVVAYIQARGAASVKVAALLDKPARRKFPFHADYLGFPIEPKFVVGYGLDDADRWRNLPDVWALD